MCSSTYHLGLDICFQMNTTAMALLMEGIGQCKCKCSPVLDNLTEPAMLVPAVAKQHR